ncbi:MAG: hypothetical protein OXD44_12065, partial [Gammaproteobacteria bacterium]|nr:hypothetical protein [Gammaproteobacteria bacterium]
MQQVVELFQCRLQQGFCQLIMMACIGCVVAIPLPAAAQNSDLPELETSASRHLNTVQERRIGQGFYRRLLASPRFVEDYLLQHYIHDPDRVIRVERDGRTGEPSPYVLV